LVSTIAFFIQRSITRPLSAFMQFVGLVGQGDLRQESKIQTGDELDELGRCLDQKVLGLKDVAGQARFATENLSSASAEILPSTQQHAASTGEQAAAVQQTTVTMEEVMQSGAQKAETRIPLRTSSLRDAETCSVNRSKNSQAQRIVLFGEASTALSTAACLRGRRITVVSARDEPRLASRSRFVQDYIRLRERSTPQLLERLNALRSNECEPLLFLPCTDAWIEALANDLPATLELGKMLPRPASHIALTLDKMAFAREISALNLPRPLTLCGLVDPEWRPSYFPFVLKPFSTYRFEAEHGVKALVILSAREWQSIDKRFLERMPCLAQEYSVGASISVCFCTTQSGQLATAYATEKVHFSSMRGGSRVATVTRPDAIELAARFVRGTGFVGFGELEMIDSERGLLLLELNARPWRQILLSSSLGIPILPMAIELMAGREFAECMQEARTSCEWINWDQDLLFRRAARRQGRPNRALRNAKRVYEHSFLRDPFPALMHAVTISRLGPGRFLR
jgi:predicted ATP-grasp superfamily ATP-dependent carboligase